MKKKIVVLTLTTGLLVSMMSMFSFAEEDDILKSSLSYTVESTTTEPTTTTEIATTTEPTTTTEITTTIEETTTVVETTTPEPTTTVIETTTPEPITTVIETTTIEETTSKEPETTREQPTTIVEETTAETELSLPPSYNVYDDLITYSCNESLNKKCNSYIKKVPAEILYLIRGCYYQIHIVKTPGIEYGLKDICGLTIISERIIQIEANERKFKRCVVHEIAHAYDDCLGWVSDTEEFISIFNEEVNKFKLTLFKSTHYKDNRKEYFAEAFQMYIYDPKSLKASAPRTYEFMRDYIEGDRVCQYVYKESVE